MPRVLLAPLRLRQVKHGTGHFRLLREMIEGGGPCVLAVVVSRRGSGPREAGAMMLFNEAGPVAGTVGGGLLEARVADLARQLAETGGAVLEPFALDADAAAGEGMICGGSMEVLVSRLVPGPDAALEIYRRAESCADGSGTCRLVTLVAGEPVGAVGLLGPCIALPGTLPLSAGEMEALFAGTGGSEPREVESSGRRYFVQPVVRPERAFIFGAGHVSRALVPLLLKVGFSPSVVDDRAEFADPRRFPEDAEVVAVDAFEGCLSPLGIDGASFVVIVTRGHRHDLSVAAQALDTPARYIGMIGSRRKREGVFSSLRSGGATDEQLRRIITPVGLPIGARTPEEIAVSIAAQMIAVRAGRGDGGARPARKGTGDG